VPLVEAEVLGSASSSDDKFPLNVNGNGRTHDIEENTDTAAVVEAVQYAQLFGKWTGSKANLGAHHEAFLKTEESACVDEGNIASTTPRGTG
jgi:hypothetical protein